MKIQNLIGTRDFYPKDMRLQNYIFSAWRKAAEKFGYEEVDAPMLESADLWKSKGELSEQMYSFMDKGDREVAIRPEFTPSLARMVAQKQKELQKPLRWYGIIRCWRYERPQTGRLREFFQFNIDCLGAESMKADAEVIATTVEILKQLKITPKEAYVRISNKKVLMELLKDIGVEDIESVLKIIDKKDKLSDNDFENLLKAAYKMNDEMVFGIKDILNITSIADLEKLKLNDETRKAVQELKDLFLYLDTYEAKDYCELDLSIIRGLDYYTGTVFEVFDRSRKFRAIAGGGRYENLVADFGGEKCPGVGLGMGDVVLQKFLEEKGKLPDLKKDVDYYVAPISDKVYAQALEISQKLRAKGNVEIDLVGRSLKKQMDYANSIGAKKVVIVGEKDLESNQVTVKNMETGKEEKQPLASL